MKREIAVALAFLMLASMFVSTVGVQAEPFVNTESQSVDPILYSTFVGGSRDTYTDDVFVDDDGFVYIVGMTFSDDFPVTLGAYDTQKSGRWDVYVMKLDPQGSIICSTFIGGNAEDRGEFIFVDDAGFIYIGGETWSSDFPTTEGAYDRTFAGYIDIYIAKFDPSLQTLLFSTLIGGTEDDQLEGMEVGADGSIYVAGWTHSSDYPTTENAYDKTRGLNERDGIVSVVSPTGSELSYSTYIGGDQADDIRDIELGSSGEVYLLGYTYSADFPVMSGSLTGNDLFLMKFDTIESKVEYSTIFGGTGGDIPLDLELDGAGCFYIAGYTFSSDFPVTLGAYDTSYSESPENYRDCFITKFDQQGTTILSSTFLGGLYTESIGGICINYEGNICIVGTTDSPDFPTTPDCYSNQLVGDGFDAFSSIMTPDLSHMVYSSLFGGLTDGNPQYQLGNDQAKKVASDAAGNLYIIGETRSFDFPVTDDAFDQTLEITPGGFLMKLDPSYLTRDFTYTIAGGEAIVTGYIGQGGDVSIPSSFGGYPTTSIGDSAFDSTNGHLITSVVIPDSVTTIGGYAFLDCAALESIVIPDNVANIGDGAFQGCTALTSTSIGSGVIAIGGAAFHGCYALTGIEVSSENIAYASVDGVVYSEDLKTLVAYPAGRHGAYEIPYGVTTIGNNAMSGCPWITSLTIPESVTTIADAGLAATSLASITIPDSVTTIGSGAFVFSPNLASVTIGSGVTTIGVRAFGYCPALSSITFEGLVAPTTLGGDWVGLENAPDLEGHAYAASDFPAPGEYFYGLLMGSNIYVPPTVAVDSPADGSFVRTSSVTVHWSATDALSEIDHYMVKLDGGRWIEVTGNGYTFTKLKAGQHTVTVQAYDGTILFDEDSASFTVDRTAPSLRITSPINGATVSSSSVTVQWAAIDSSGIAYSMVRLDGGAWVRVDRDSYTFDGISNGKHVVKVQAVDNAGNIREATVKFIVKV